MKILNLRFTGLFSKVYLVIIFAGNMIPCAAQTGFSDATEFGTTVTGDFIQNFRGGLKRGFTYLGKEELTLLVDTKKAGLWKNGCFFLHALNTHGKGASMNLTGDLQVLSNIEAGDHTGLFEFWYKQQFGHFSVLIGQHEMNSEFISSKNSHIFINSSFGVMPTLSLNMPVPIYPLAAPGIVLKCETTKNLVLRFGMYDGNPGNMENNQYNLNLKISGLEGFLNIAECEYIQIDHGHETGNYKFGTYYHSGLFPNYPDSVKSVKGDYGMYVMVDKDLFPRSFHAGHGLYFFFQGGVTDPSYNKVVVFFVAGFRYHGLLPDRFKDQLGIGLSHISISSQYHKYAPEVLTYETAMETTYILQFAKRYFIQPCVQYIFNPGINRITGNTFVGLLRFSLSY